MAKGKRARTTEKTFPRRVDPAWERWVAENLALSASPTEVVRALAEENLSTAEAQRLVDGVLSSPLFEAYADERRKRARRDQVLALAERLRKTTRIERRKTPSAEEFFSRYFARNTPCVFTDFTEGWAARAWTPAWLRETFSGVEIEIASGRSKSKTPDRQLDRHREKTTMDAYVDRVLVAGESNDIYTVANNKNMDRPALDRLLRDVVFRADYFLPDHLRGGTSFWFGPAGTTTTLHHDTTNILFHQFFGKKRFMLAPPSVAELLDAAEGFYSKVDPRTSLVGANGEPLVPPVFEEVVLEPGETLFLPVGYWHEVVALTVSISFSQLNLQRPNAFEEYHPGRARLDE